jgi:hypothetical protein
MGPQLASVNFYHTTVIMPSYLVEPVLDGLEAVVQVRPLSVKVPFVKFLGSTLRDAEEKIHREPHGKSISTSLGSSFAGTQGNKGLVGFTFFTRGRDIGDKLQLGPSTIPAGPTDYGAITAHATLES